MLFILFLQYFYCFRGNAEKRSKEKTDTETDTNKQNKLGRVLSLPGFLYGLSDNLGGTADTFLVCVGVHP